MNKNNKTFFLIIIIIVIIFIIGLYFFQSKNNLINTNLNKDNFNNPQVSKIITNSDKENIQEYLKNNISSLSPQKEVLGGKFYITNINFLDNNHLIVDYEDGHIALKAKVEFKINNENKIQILNFNIIKNN